MGAGTPRRRWCRRTGPRRRPTPATLWPRRNAARCLDALSGAMAEIRTEGCWLWVPRAAALAGARATEARRASGGGGGDPAGGPGCGCTRRGPSACAGGRCAPPTTGKARRQRSAGPSATWTRAGVGAGPGSAAALAALGPAGRRAAAATEGAAALTRREREVARLAARGLTAQEIGAKLFIGRRTVETHLANAYAKLRISGRVDLIVAPSTSGSRISASEAAQATPKGRALESTARRLAPLRGRAGRCPRPARRHRALQRRRDGRPAGDRRPPGRDVVRRAPRRSGRA